MGFAVLPSHPPIKANPIHQSRPKFPLSQAILANKAYINPPQHLPNPQYTDQKSSNSAMERLGLRTEDKNPELATTVVESLSRIEDKKGVVAAVRNADGGDYLE